MSLRRAARRDTIEQAICETLDSLRVPWRKVSCDGLPDLEVIIGRKPYLVELKSGKKPHTDAQLHRLDWLQRWEVHVDVHAPTWRSVDDCIRWVASVRRGLL